MTRLRASLSFLVYLSVAYAQQPSDLIWQLGDVDRYRPTHSPYLGYQNFTWCCVKAVAEALEVESGLLKLRTGYDDWIVVDSGNISDLVRYTDSSLFPCTATYVKGNNNGAPLVRVPYEWFVDVCPGWQLNDNTNLNAWLQPLSGFILPAVIFCLSVPRRRKLRVPRALFSPELSRSSSYLVVLPGAILAGIMVSIDTIIWLCTCFAFAGPMILSGLYEALLDNRMLDFVKEKIRNKHLTLDMRCRLLMVVLIGNLDLALDESQNDAVQPEGIRSPSQSGPYRSAPAEPVSSNNDESAEQSASHVTVETAFELENLRPTTRERSGSRTSQLSATTQARNRASQEASAIVVRRPTDHLQASPWRHMEDLLYDIRLYEVDHPTQELSPRQIACVNANHHTVPRPRTAKIERQIRKTKRRLRTMLHCQYSFGSIVGAPIIFFLGGFVFALLQSLTIIGDESVALGLAFGQWYMTIPHIAIVSGLLLAGNNPNILEGVFATVRDDPKDRGIGLFGLRFELAYPSCYKVAWQWLRGPTKRRWIGQVIQTYHHIEDKQCRVVVMDDDIDELQRRTILSLLDWSLILTLTSLLLGVPLILAFLTAFYTPEVGISCRSLTITIYGFVQFGQILLWLWAYAGPPAKVEDSRAITNFFCEKGWLDSHGFYTPTSVKHFMGRDPSINNPLNSEDRVRPRKFWTVESLWCVIWYGIALILLITSVCAALGGTLMQLIGLYTTNICKITTGSWFAPLSQRPVVLISVNSPDRISHALQYWVPCAVTAIIFMMVVGFMAWWYQRRMRDMFSEIVRTVDDEKWDRPDTAWSRQQQ